MTLAACGTPSTSNNPEATAKPEVIELTQTGCQFLETEAKDYEFTTAKKADCEAINAETLSDRQGDFETLELKAGSYVFRVTNKNVPYELGFYLRGKGAAKVSLPKVSGGGLTEGETQDYEISLRPGKYLFSCPLNSTPDYEIVVN
ncbi:MAG: hypothetical protein F6J87_03865 [Spirulina sp. SIO3F2]|nr:hypothetical protein [Spirulina sp. SIO3F2]